ncbi:MAG TPA: VWA domain-containing protein [Terriglobales bacterium]|nr:VWA domain-containing protein [Terriglobales bacterium]
MRARLRWCGRVLWLMAAGASLLCAQSKSLPEVRVSAHPYTLPPPVIRAQTSLVTLDVVVRQSDGALVTNLGRADFQVLDNAQPRPLAAFSVVASPTEAELAPNTSAAPAAVPKATAAPPPPLPRSVVLYFDDVNTDGGDLANARIAAGRFIQEGMLPGDHIAIFTASAVQTQDFTTDQARLQAAIAAIRTHPRASPSVIPCPRITAYQAFLITIQHEPDALQAAVDEAQHCSGGPPVDSFNGRTLSQLGLSAVANQEAVLAQAESTWAQAQGVSFDTLHSMRSVVDYLAKQPGNRMLLIASGGFLSGGSILAQQQDDVVEAALHAGIVINGLDAKGLYSDGPGRPISELVMVDSLPLSTFTFEETSKMSMRQAQSAAVVKMAQSTGGLYFENNNDLTLGFKRVGMVPGVRYQLAFDPGAGDGKYHKLKITIAPAAKPGKLLIQYRPGYFAGLPTTDAPTLSDRIGAAMRGDDVLSAAPAAVAALAAAGQVSVTVTVDANRLNFTENQGRRRQDLFFVAGLFDAGNHWVTGKMGEMDLAITPATYEKMLAQGLAAKLTLDARPGDYHLRVVTAEASTGRLTAITQAVRIP